MDRKEELNNLLTMLNELQKGGADLVQSMTELKQCIASKKFLSAETLHQLENDIKSVSDRQSEFLKSYASSVSKKIPAVWEEAKKEIGYEQAAYKKIEPYMDDIIYFNSIHSENPDTETILKKYKEEIRGLNLRVISEDELAKRLDKFVVFRRTYCEVDQKKRFHDLYSLFGKFEEAVIEEMQFKTFYVKQDEQSDVLNFQNNEPACEEPEEKIMGIHGHMIAEEEAAEEKAEADKWKELKIEHKQEVTCMEDSEKLSVEASAKAARKFVVKEFKKELTQENSAAKVACLKALTDYTILTESSMEALYGKKFPFLKENLAQAIDSLYQEGYLKKYIIEGTGEFYALSSRGLKIFTTKESEEFMYSKTGLKYEESRQGEIEDTYNAALVRMIILSSVLRVKKLKESFDYKSCGMIMGAESCLAKYKKVLKKGNLFFTSICSESAFEFEEFIGRVLKYVQDDDYLVVLGVTMENAEAVAKVVREKLQEKGCTAAVSYSSAFKNVCYPLETKEPVEFQTFSAYEGRTDEDDDLELTEEEEFLDDLTEEELELELTEEAGEDLDVELTEEAEEDLIEDVQEDYDIHSQDTKVIYVKEEENPETEYLRYLEEGKFYCAAAYLKSLSLKNKKYLLPYKQVAYAVNDPIEGCSYNTDTLIDIYYTGEKVISDYLTAAAAFRGFFLGMNGSDYMVQRFYSTVSDNRVIKDGFTLNYVLYKLQQFKSLYKYGIDKYADYRHGGDSEEMMQEIDPALDAYRSLSVSLVKGITTSIEDLQKKQEDRLCDRAGREVLLAVLQELKDKLTGDYVEGSDRYFYIDFLRNDSILLDEEYLPVLTEVEGLPELSVRRRIAQHCAVKAYTWEERLQSILNGQYDYGSAHLIINYLKEKGTVLENIDIDRFDLEEAFDSSLSKITDKRDELIGSIEAACSEGQTQEKEDRTMEMIIKNTQPWFRWAENTKNYGFFIKVLQAFKNTIQ